MKQEILRIKVKIGSKKESVTYKDGLYTVYTNGPAKENRANISVIEQLSKYLDIPKSNITVKRGLKSKNKIVTVFRK